MNKFQKLAESVRQLDKDVVLAAASLCDGHGIFDPQALLDLGVPADVVEHNTTTYESDGSPKGSISNSRGDLLATCRGVYGLHFLEYLAGCFSLRYQRAFGRGTQARRIQEALFEHFEVNASEWYKARKEQESKRTRSLKA